MKEERTGWLARIAAIVALGQINIFLTMIAAFVLGAAAIFLTTAWLFGPKIQLEHSQYARFTASSGGRIVESWVALELDRSRVRSSEFWRASAKVGYTLAELREITPGVPFEWPKDDRGFAIPEIRMAPETWQWLESHSAHKFMHSEWPASNELDWLRLELDRPVDQAVAGWSALPALVPLQFDPAHPDRSLPSGTVAKRRAARPNWLAVVTLGGIGLWLWVTGFRLVPQLAGLAPQWRWFVMALPLLTLPTWVDTFPQFLQPMSAQWTTVIADMLSDLDPLDRLEATDARRALLADGVKMRWMASAGAYRNTLGRMTPTMPLSHPQDPDSALLAFSNAITERVSSLSADERVALFAQLRSDKQRDLKAAGIVFLAAAREWRQRSSGADGRAAAAFLTEWNVSPVESPDPHGLAIEARKTLSQQ